MDLLVGLAASVTLEAVTNRELYDWKIQLVAWVSFSGGNYCVSRTEAFCRGPFDLPTIIW